jgi:hypothetical protein
VVFLPFGVLIVLGVGALMGDLTFKEWMAAIAAVAIVGAAWS